MANISENAQTILEKRYLRNDETKAEQMFRRVAKEISKAEKPELQQECEEEFFKVMDNLDFLPNSPCLMNSGTDMKQFSACFVLPMEDELCSIYDGYKYAALVSKTGGGTGFSFSRLRPNGEQVGSTNGVASGPVSWMKVQDASTEAVKQGGRRRGANMGCLRVDHPDIKEFIYCKDNGKTLNNFNLSVCMTDKFMEAVKYDKEFELKFNGKVKETVKARELFEETCQHAWLRGDPGVIFIDVINKYNPTPHLGDIESTNPCGEQPLLPFEACNLGSLNLYNMIVNKQIDYDKLERITRIAVRFLDDVISVSEFPLPQITDLVNGNRKIGLGVMGWADMLFELEIPYNSQEAINLAKKVMNFIWTIGCNESKNLGREKGVYPNSQGDLKRNATVTTIAPTGTISQIADVWGGIEPLFGLVWVRLVPSMNNLKLYNIHPIFKKKLEELGLYSEELLQKISNNHGSVQGLSEIPADIQKIFVVASDITPEWHVKMQAAFQVSGVDNAVSKTINLPHNATVEDVKNIYMMAYDLGCRGITIYRDGSLDGQPLTSGSDVKKDNTTDEQQFIEVKSPLEEAYGKRKKYETGCGSIWLKIFNDEDGNLREIFSQSSGGGCKANIETISRLVSLLLRANVNPSQIMDQLSSAYCKTCYDKTKCKSCGDVISKQIKRFLDEDIKIIPVDKNKKPNQTGQKNILTIKPEDVKETSNEFTCPECGSKVTFTEGCNVCISCGFSKCK